MSEETTSAKAPDGAVFPASALLGLDRPKSVLDLYDIECELRKVRAIIESLICQINDEVADARFGTVESIDPEWLCLLEKAGFVAEDISQPPDGTHPKKQLRKSLRVCLHGPNGPVELNLSPRSYVKHTRWTSPADQPAPPWPKDLPDGEIAKIPLSKRQEALFACGSFWVALKKSSPTSGSADVRCNEGFADESPSPANTDIAKSPESADT